MFVVCLSAGCLPSQGSDGDSQPREVERPGGVIDEVETPDDEPTPVEMNRYIRGSIDGTDTSGDWDYYSLYIEGGTHYQVEITDWSDGVDVAGRPRFAVQVYGPNQLGKVLTGRHATKRDFFAEESGEYQIWLLDLQNLGPHSGDPFVGVNGTYELAISEVTPAVRETSLPRQKDVDWSDRQATVLSLTFDEETIVVAETFAERLEPPSQLDTTLAVWNETEQTTVAFNDSHRTEDGWVIDAKVGFRAKPNHVYHVIGDPFAIENFRASTPDVEYRLELSEGDEATLEELDAR